MCYRITAVILLHTIHLNIMIMIYANKEINNVCKIKKGINLQSYYS